MNPSSKAKIISYFDAKLKAFGPRARGVDWNSEESQNLRFDQLLRALPARPDISLIDYGCGYGAFFEYLMERKFTGPFQGYDFSQDMLQAAGTKFNAPNAKWIHDPAALQPADYVVASGIFNLKLDVANKEWEGYIFDTMDKFNDLGKAGFACNFLTSYSDADKQRPDLYYTDPVKVFDHCKRRYGRFVSLLHDYPLYEFTIAVKKSASG